ncbi:globin domain-containing protein [Actinoplanes sp. NPDC024001]|uniref:globin domain-containing protein n=1 Tax=Actinoplanes sp. NPDC024001 TaxID=3154598 RepID=UPI0033F36AD7
MADLTTVLKDSWNLVADRSDQVVEHFYARLFLAFPQLRDLFPVQMRAQRDRLLSAIVSAVHHFDDPVRLDAWLRGLGRDHRKFEVRPEHYAQVKVCLLDAIRSHAGDRWNDVYEQAWNDAYDLMADRMIAGAGERDDPPYWDAEVLSHERRGPDVAVFTCRPRQPFTFRAGQYVSLECPYRPRLWRSYSIANSPREDGTLEFHVRATGAGWVSSALVRRLRAGDVLHLAAPMGSMTLDVTSRRDVVLVAGGTGLAPAKALLGDLVKYNRTRWVHLFRGERQRDGFYDREQLDLIAERYPWLSIVRAVSDEPGYPGERGALHDVLSRHGPWRDHDFYVAGSGPMVNATLRRLAEMRVPSTRIRYDAFTDG